MDRVPTHLSSTGKDTCSHTWSAWGQVWLAAGIDIQGNPYRQLPTSKCCNISGKMPASCVWNENSKVVGKSTYWVRGSDEWHFYMEQINQSHDSINGKFECHKKHYLLRSLVWILNALQKQAHPPTLMKITRDVGCPVQIFSLAPSTSYVELYGGWHP